MKLHQTSVAGETLSQLPQYNGIELDASSCVPRMQEALTNLNGTNKNGALSAFLESEGFQGHRDSVKRFLALLSWLHLMHPKEFALAAFGFQRRKRIYFAESRERIVRSGESVGARLIPQSRYWTLTTMSNEYKRVVLDHILRALHYSPAEIDLVLAELPNAIMHRRPCTDGNGKHVAPGHRPGLVRQNSM